MSLDNAVLDASNAVLSTFVRPFRALSKAVFASSAAFFASATCASVALPSLITASAFFKASSACVLAVSNACLLASVLPAVDVSWLMSLDNAVLDASNAVLSADFTSYGTSTISVVLSA